MTSQEPSGESLACGENLFFEWFPDFYFWGFHLFGTWVFVALNSFSVHHIWRHRCVFFYSLLKPLISQISWVMVDQCKDSTSHLRCGIALVSAEQKHAARKRKIRPLNFSVQTRLKCSWGRRKTTVWSWKSSHLFLSQKLFNISQISLLGFSKGRLILFLLADKLYNAQLLDNENQSSEKGIATQLPLLCFNDMANLYQTFSLLILN